MSTSTVPRRKLLARVVLLIGLGWAMAGCGGGGGSNVGQSGFPVLGGASNPVTQVNVPRTQAVASVRAATAGLSAETMFILGPTSPVSPGTIVQPSLGNSDGATDTALQFQFSTPQWFFFVDPVASGMYQHPVIYYFVDAISGQLTTRNATSWPQIGNAQMYEVASASLGTADLVARPTNAAFSGTRAPTASSRSAVPRGAVDFTAATDCCPSGGKTVALFITGYDEPKFQDGAATGASLIGANGIPPLRQRFDYTPPRIDPQGDLQTLFQAACRACQPCDTLMIFINTHGNEVGGGLCLQKIDGAGNRVDHDVFNLSNLDFGLDKCKACNILIIQDSCYSGGSLDRNLNGSFSKYRGLTGQGARNVVFITSTAADKPGLATPTDGCVFTHDLGEASKSLPPGSGITELFDAGAKLTNGRTFPSSTDQKPTIEVSLRQPDKRCGTCTASPSPSQSPTPTPSPSSSPSPSPSPSPSASPQATQGVAAGGSLGVGMFIADPQTGGLTVVAGSPFKTSSNVRVLGAHGSVLTAVGGDNKLNAFTIDPVTLGLTPFPGPPPTIPGTSASAVAILNNFIYISNLNGGTPNLVGYSYTVSPPTLSLLAGFPMNTPTINSLVANNAGSLLAEDVNGSGIFINSVNGDGSLTQAAGGPYPSRGGMLVFDPTDGYLYAGDNTAGSGATTVSGYSVDPLTRLLTPVPNSPTTSFFHRQSVAMDPSGKFIYIGCPSSMGISVYARVPQTGALTEIPGSPFATDTSYYGLTTLPNGLLYALDLNTGKAVGFSLQGGVLVKLAGSPFGVDSPAVITSVIGK